MTSDRRALIPLRLFLVWAAMAAVVPTVGFGLLVAGWGGGTGAMVPLAALSLPLTVGLLAVMGASARTFVPLCGTVPGRLGWAVTVFVLGTLGVAAGLAAYGEDIDLGSAGLRFALVGVPYAVAAAFFVPSRRTRLAAVAALVAAVVYGGFVGPAQSQERRHEAEIAKYREQEELLYMGAAPSGMTVARAYTDAGYFTVEYRPTKQDVMGSADLNLRRPITPSLQCPEPVRKDETCVVDAHGDMVVSHPFTGSVDVTVVRRIGRAEATVSSQTLDAPGLRHLLDSLRPLSDAELEELMREKKIDRR
ncbi:hypothetical protein [Streptomyces sp. ITFR-16]|uniref:hypothetical protein n=1 Tax=Streptomyces sp. ITFR-16 TaxID=3075198 RepID=UPI0028897E70|nr:hypothetical protein [Streptomyces sp. ITFR-16]WNI26662.1 hypothetical protein RLT58_34385 [Streptomyces sp. ITFR-16]